MLVDREEIDLLGAARGVGDAGNVASACYCVDQAGFADIGTAGKSDLGRPRDRRPP
jgi:hypothetical protein